MESSYLFGVAEMERLGRVLIGGLSITHLLWAAALLLEPAKFTHKITHPILFGLIHTVAAVIMMSRLRTAGLALSAGVLGYYWVSVKPLEPIAEPQSVGIMAISTSELLRNLFKEDFFARLLLRAGLAYPLIEWGLDALRNPSHFAYYLSTNTTTSQALHVIPLYPAIWALGLYEILLGLWVVSGVMVKPSSTVLLATLLVFSVVAGYPLALPQNIALISAALALGFRRISSFS